jgi:hypothetical protein
MFQKRQKKTTIITITEENWSLGVTVIRSYEGDTSPPCPIVAFGLFFRVAGPSAFTCVSVAAKGHGTVVPILLLQLRNHTSLPFSVSQ